MERRHYDHLLEIMRGRRSIRRFEARPISPDTWEKLLEVIRWAPSASNRQGYRFVLVTNTSVIRQMAEAVRHASEELSTKARDDYRDDVDAYLKHFDHFADAPAAIVPIYRQGMDLLKAITAASDGPSAAPRALLEGISAVAAATMNLLLSAHALGLGACWMTGPLIAAPALDALLEVPKGWAIASVIPVGYPAETPQAPKKRPLQQMLRRIENES